MISTKEIRAFYTNSFIRVYQAYNNTIADATIANKRFISPPFKTGRTTWIKPSFLWMMYRSGWATKENQERILAIDITHEGFLWAINNACLSHFDNEVYNSHEEWLACKKKNPVIIQWDPERDITLNKLDYKTIQIGLSPSVVPKYINEWIVNIEDITMHCTYIHQLIIQKEISQANDMLPKEVKYHLSGYLN
jgi:hypothetical protein